MSSNLKSYVKSTSDLLLHHQLVCIKWNRLSKCDERNQTPLHKSQPNQIFIIKICLCKQHAHAHTDLILWTVKNRDKAIYIFACCVTINVPTQFNAHYNITGFYFVEDAHQEHAHTFFMCETFLCVLYVSVHREKIVRTCYISENLS